MSIVCLVTHVLCLYALKLLSGFFGTRSGFFGENWMATLLQNEAALMSCRIQAVEHTKCSDGLTNAQPGLKDRILLNYTRIENAHKVRKKTFKFLFCIKVQQTFCFIFSLLRHYQMDASMLKTAVFELM